MFLSCFRLIDSVSTSFKSFSQNFYAIPRARKHFQDQINLITVFAFPRDQNDEFSSSAI